MTTRALIGLVAALMGVAVAGPVAATEEAGSGRAGACGAMGFRTFGVDDGSDDITINDQSLVPIIELDLELRCSGPALATFYAQAARTSGGNPSAIFLEALCVAPAVAGGCNLGTLVRSEPRGTNQGGPNSPFFQQSGESAGTAVVLGVFPALPPGHYVFRARGKTVIGGQLDLNDRALIVQAYGTPPPPSAGR